MTTLKSIFTLTLITLLAFIATTNTATAQFNLPNNNYQIKPTPQIKIPKVTDYTHLSFQPDLVVTSITATGPAVRNAQGKYELPIRVVVKNQGNANAGKFKVSVNHSCVSGDCPSYYGSNSFVLAFSVPGQSTWYPFVNSLNAGQSRTLNGKLTFSNQGTYRIQGIVDSGSGDEFMPDYIRVKESDEGNNYSTPRQVSIH